jgi:hypothetical protein
MSSFFSQRMGRRLSAGCSKTSITLFTPTSPHAVDLALSINLSAHPSRPESNTAGDNRHPRSSVVACAQGYRFRWSVGGTATHACRCAYSKGFAPRTPGDAAAFTGLPYPVLHLPLLPAACPQLLSSPRVLYHAMLGLRRTVYITCLRPVYSALGQQPSVLP